MIIRISTKDNRFDQKNDKDDNTECSRFESDIWDNDDIDTLCLRRYLSPLSVIEDSLTLARLTCVTNITTLPIRQAMLILEKHL